MISSSELELVLVLRAIAGRRPLIRAKKCGFSISVIYGNRTFQALAFGKLHSHHSMANAEYEKLIVISSTVFGYNVSVNVHSNCQTLAFGNLHSQHCMANTKYERLWVISSTCTQGRLQGVCLGGGGAKCLATAAPALKKLLSGGTSNISPQNVHNVVGVLWTWLAAGLTSKTKKIIGGGGAGRACLYRVYLSVCIVLIDRVWHTLATCSNTTLWLTLNMQTTWWVTSTTVLVLASV